MGLLDDAIREHLDLKRRRGADPAEVELAEREALGPVRRNREASAVHEPGDSGLAYDQAAGDEDWTYGQSGESVQDDERNPPPLERAHDELDAPPGRRADSQPGSDETDFGESAFEEPAFDDEPPPQTQPPRFARGAAPAGAAEHDVEEPAAADEKPHDDMLEETPEFLQDTPDHDRLWFEQRPPKDFDFDG